MPRVSRARGVSALLAFLVVPPPTDLAAASVACLPSHSSSAWGRAQDRPVNLRAATLQAFTKRLEAYMSLRRDAEDRLPALEQTKNPAEITQRQSQLAAEIKKARGGVKKGALLSPDIADVMADAVRRDLLERTAAERAATLDAVPPVRLQVHDRYPPDKALGTVPPRLLAKLPRLPVGLEYRLVGRDLILRDIDANLVLDVLPDVLPRSGKGPGLDRNPLLP